MQTLKITAILIASYIFIFPIEAQGAKPMSLEERLQESIAGDRTGKCLVVAKIGQKVQRAKVCANKADLNDRSIDFDTTFEIGSISKLMTGNVLAGLINEKKLTLNDTLESILPPGFKVPKYQNKPILLKHVVTHSSGLPAIPSVLTSAPSDPDNPYSSLTEKSLKTSLQDVTLGSAPGTQMQYSNFAMILLSLGLAHASNVSFDELLAKYVFSPVGMKSAFTAQPKKGTVFADGHIQTGKKTSHWDFPTNMHGVGGIRASLNDLVLYAQANLDSNNKKLSHLITAQKAILSPSEQTIGINWFHSKLGEQEFLFHEGGTGGFSSLIMINPNSKTAIIILSDTALTNIGGLGELAFSLISSDIEAPKPRVTIEAPQDLLKQLSGEYELTEANLKLSLWSEKGKLFGQATGQQKIEFAYDSHGDFYPISVDALLKPAKSSTGLTFDWFQGGGSIRAKRLDMATTKEFVPDSKHLTEYAGTYPLIDGFGLTVRALDDGISIQGTNQQALKVTPVDKDEFSYDSVDAYFIFNRDDHGKVVSLTLKQAGQTLTGSKQ
ncbi:MAG: serine hydrolase [Gammaproteobacteria bacterium]|nr:serine hydrolase [Gammaproteobacteria bacterium]